MRFLLSLVLCLLLLIPSRAQAHVPTPLELTTEIPAHRLTLGPELSVGFIHYGGKTTSGATLGVRLDFPWRENFELYAGAGIGIGALLLNEEPVKAVASVREHAGMCMTF